MNRTIFSLRRDVEDKLNRLPLPYFDAQPRGELLSRVTNDIDNVAQSLQQTLSQLLTSLLTVVAMVAMMLYISPLLALIALVTIPVSMVGHGRDRQALAEALRAAVEEHRRAQRGRRGDLHRPRAGQGLRSPARGRARRSPAKNDDLYDAGFGAQFVSGIIMPTMMFIGNLNYVVIAVVGGLRVAQRLDEPGRRAGVHPVLAPVHPAADPGRVDGQPAPVRGGLRRAGVRGAGRRRAAARTRPTRQRCDDPHGRVEFEDVSFSYDPDNPLIEHLDLVVEPGPDRGHRGPDRRRQDHAGQPRHAVLRARRRPHHPRRRRHHRPDPARPALRDRHGPAGHLAVRRHHPRQHRLRPPGRDRRGGARGGAGHLRRPVRALAARRLRHGPRRRGRQHQRGREAARHDRARVPLRPRAAHPRRGHQLGRHPHRAPRAAGDVGAAHRPHELRDRPPAVHDPRRRRHPRDGGRPDRRAGLARGAARSRRAYARLYAAQFSGAAVDVDTGEAPAPASPSAPEPAGGRR